MRKYSKAITFSKNSRGVYSIDPSIGCKSGVKNSPGGCYGDCYAYNIANRYGYDFAQTVYRDFINDHHLEHIKKQIQRIDMPFIRMGTMGDPSENWDHTLTICEALQNDVQYSLFARERKEIVIITKHWHNLTNRELFRLKKLKVCINSSVSALDNDAVRENAMKQYRLLKGFCRSILRVVTCDFNKAHPDGFELSKIQDDIIGKNEYIDTVFRPTKNNPLVLNGVINVKKKRFIKGKQLMSKLNKSSYLGRCENCKEMCGVTM